MARHRPYTHTLHTIMEHGYFFLLDVLLYAEDAPLPHVMYEDFMRCMTFASWQTPPEWQFALPPHQLQTMLCTAANHCTLDRHYFTTVRALFVRMEQQQHMSPAVLSAWVYACTAAGETDTALRYAQHMTRHDMDFDPQVFALMQHPSVNPRLLARGALPPSVISGMILQRRLCSVLHSAYGSASVALHAMLVFHALTLRPAGVWEVLRKALEIGLEPTARTLAWVMEMFAMQKGVRCGARTVCALIRYLVRAAAAAGSRTTDTFRVRRDTSAGRRGTTESEKDEYRGGFDATAAARVVYILMRVRWNERVIPALAALPPTAFSDEECEEILYTVRVCARRDESFRIALPILQRLLPVGEEQRQRQRQWQRDGDDETRVGPLELVRSAGSDAWQRRREAEADPAKTRRTEKEEQRCMNTLDSGTAWTATTESASSSRPHSGDDCMSVLNALAQAVKALDRPFGASHASSTSMTESSTRGDEGVCGESHHASDDARFCETSAEPSPRSLSPVLRDFLMQLRELDRVYKRPASSSVPPGPDDNDDDKDGDCDSDGVGEPSEGATTLTDTNAPDDAAEAYAIHATLQQLEAMQTHTSLRHFTERVLRDAAREARLAKHVQTAWIELS